MLSGKSFGFLSTMLVPYYTSRLISTIFSPPEYRVDDYGNLMKRDKYGDINSQLGWEVDHILPISNGGTNIFSNLRPLNISKNRSR